MPLMQNLNYVFRKKDRAILSAQLERVSRLWHGEILVKNIIAFELLQFKNWEFFQRLSSSLTTLFTYNQKLNGLSVDPLFTSPLQKEVLKAYISQFNHFKSENKHTQKRLNENLKVLSYLAYKNFDFLSLQDHISIFEMVGDGSLHLKEYLELMAKQKLGNVDVLSFAVNVPIRNSEMEE